MSRLGPGADGLECRPTTGHARSRDRRAAARMVVGVDGSPQSHIALHWAVEQARRTGPSSRPGALGRGSTRWPPGCHRPRWARVPSSRRCTGHHRSGHRRGAAGRGPALVERSHDRPRCRPRAARGSPRRGRVTPLPCCWRPPTIPSCWSSATEGVARWPGRWPGRSHCAACTTPAAQSSWSPTRPHPHPWRD
ncbi:MAG: hypothetical protein GEV09_16785 [Pseudonocardiaceae bacterium]|nr:hypothetical protein [Pseudonocardiaceae bacterium]